VVGNLWAVSYAARKTLVFDGGFNRGLTDTSTRWEAFVGFTYLLPHRLRKPPSAAAASGPSPKIRLETNGSMTREARVSRPCREKRDNRRRAGHFRPARVLLRGENR
jgi:hypothetical protein